MSQPTNSTQKRQRRFIIGGLASLFIIIAAGVGIWFYQQQDGPEGSNGDGFTIPTLQTETAASNLGSGIESVGFSPTDAAASLLISLSEGQSLPDAVEANPLVTGDPLTEAEIAQILARLPELVGEATDEQDFNLPDELIPPPRPGTTVEQAFPPPPTDFAPPEVPTGPLEVLRYSPEGEIGLAPFVNVTFNQPMVPLTDLTSLTEAEVPVNLTPDIPGTWQWVSPQVLRFEADADAVDRLPMATEFVAEIPAGTTSATGNALAETVRWTFSTPPVQMMNHYPAEYEPQPLEPIIFVTFDQLIEPEAILAVTRLTAAGDSEAIRLATEAEIAADESVSRRIESARDGRWVAFRAERPLPPDSEINVTVGPNIPSAEGTRLNPDAQTFTFYTYPPLRLVHDTCGWSDNDCPPLTPFHLEFNNPLDPDLFSETMIRIEPELPGATVQLNYSGLTIQGLTQGRTTYEVFIDAGLTDIFGQTLGEEETARFRVDSATPFVSGPRELLVTADPSASDPSLTLFVMNYDEIQVKLYAVTPDDWPAYMRYLRALDEMDEDDEFPTPPGNLVVDEMMAVDAVEDVLTETAVSLQDALDGDAGHVIAVIQPPTLSRDFWERRRQIIHTWVQVTQIGLDAFADHSQLIAWTTDLADGRPLSDITLSTNGNQTRQTNANGLAEFELSGSGIRYLVATQGEDTAILPASTSYWDEHGWQAHTLHDELRWHIFDDRAMYRPGETVSIKGWLRHISGEGAITLPGERIEEIRYILYGPQGNVIAEGETNLTPFGGFDLQIELPENTNLGYAYMELRAVGSVQNLGGEYGFHEFQIQEFRRPEFEVSARQESVGPYVVGDSATVAVTASYFAGGPLPNADTSWYVTSTPTYYSPPGWREFTFGTWTPWWYFDGYGYEEEFFYYDYGFPGDFGAVAETFSGVTNGGGEHFLQIDFEALEGNRPFTVRAEATVMDVNRQAWSSNTSLLVHPADLYVGLRSDSTFVEQGEPLEIEAIVTDIDGEAVADTAVSITAARLEWNYSNSGWREEAVDVQTCDVTSAGEPVTCTFETDAGGQYEITAVVTDAQGRQNQSQLTRWVSGGKQPVQRNVTQETVTLIPDKEAYQPGDVAEILVQSPFGAAEGLLTLSRNGILSTEQFTLEDGSSTLRIPITEDHIPNLTVKVDLAGSAPRTDDAGEELADVPPRPAFATGSLNLSVPPYSRELSIAINPQSDSLEPGAETAVSLTVTDANGQTVPNAEVALVVVDEAILALTGYQLRNPLDIFYTNQWSWIDSRYGRSSIILVNPESLANEIETTTQTVEVTRVVAELVTESLEFEEEAMDEEGSFDDAEALDFAAAPAEADSDARADGSATPIDLRSNFDPLAVFAPVSQTDGSGQAEIRFTLPDNLTRYRIMAVAVAGDNLFGSAESNLTARLPLMVRPSAPRFLNYGDQFELPIVMQNQTDEPMTVDVALDVTNLTLTAGAGQRVTVPANDRVEVRFPATTSSAGTARFQVAVVSGDYADAASGEMPVYTPATTEAFATYGTLDEGVVAQPFVMPAGVIPGYGGLEINTSSTALQALTDAVIYLTEHRYDSADEYASRILTVAALRDMLTAFEADKLPAPGEMEMAVVRDIEALQGLQNPDGGFPIWERNRESYPFHTVHVAHALAMASQKGYTVPAEMQANVQSYLQNIESYYPHWYSQQTRWALSAYALYVRHLAGDSDFAKARALLDEAGIENLSLEANAWLWDILADDPNAAEEVAAIRQLINNRAVETADAANFTTSYGEEAYLMLHSNRRTDGIILQTLINQSPDSDLIPKVVNGLLAHRTRGHWGSSQENVFILLALDSYFNTFEAETPDFVAQIWLGETYAGAQEFVGRSTDRYLTEIPMGYLAEEEVGDVIVSVDGDGRLYYRLALNYAPTDLSLDPLNRGFVVERTYEAVDDPEDVWQDEDGTWHIKLGARVRVRLTLVADNRRYHVALVDPLPAGLEAINPALAVSQSVPADPNDVGSSLPWWWWWQWYDHQNMRDERVEAFSALLWEGVYSYDYVARATTPGTFIVPPTKAEEMYAPDVFGRSGSDVVIVE
ncbi:alpha-2-macroglobulin family protein [Candidatus Leptofilum sp.]|uniref:alpha-2-macroglobulin family protein n=1 Tax=Candidatus Leptofilum sp. TaxID=3241576 RepID=UPI003B5CB30E